jgi:hypothetical protein
MSFTYANSFICFSENIFYIVIALKSTMTYIYINYYYIIMIKINLLVG